MGKRRHTKLKKQEGSMRSEEKGKWTKRATKVMNSKDKKSHQGYM
jgi:hypothetical protein